MYGLNGPSSLKKRALIVLLLIISCTASGYLLLMTEATPVYSLKSPRQLDSLITDSFREFNISNSQIRTQNIQIDSSFTRKRYVIEVDPAFSKTSFHYRLHERLWPYNTGTIGHVEFPERNLQVHIAYNQTIHRTIYLYSQTKD